MDDFVSMHNLLSQSQGFRTVHLEHLLDALVVAFLETLVLLLELLKEFGELLIVFGQFVVLLLIVALLLLEFRLNTTHDILEFPLLLLKGVLGLVINGFTLAQNLVVEVELFFVQTVDSTHVLHALFQNLHLLLKLDFLLGL